MISKITSDFIPSVIHCKIMFDYVITDGNVG